MNVTNKDAKIIYSRYWYKNFGMDMFPVIYIDEYWEYIIDLFNLRNSWETFLKKFNDEFDSAKQYIEESNRILDILKEKLFTPDVVEKLNLYQEKEYHFPQVNVYLIPDGEYWVIDIKEAGNQALKYINGIQPGVEYDDIIKQITSSSLLQNSKILRLQLYYRLETSFLYKLYNIDDKLLYDISQSMGIPLKDITGICGDALYISKDKMSLIEEDCKINGIDIHIKMEEVKSTQYNGEIIKYLDSNGLTYFYKNNSYVSIDEYPCIMKHIKNQQPNQMDQTVGFEEQILY